MRVRFNWLWFADIYREPMERFSAVRVGPFSITWPPVRFRHRVRCWFYSNDRDLDAGLHIGPLSFYDQVKP